MNDLKVINKYPHNGCSLLYFYQDCSTEKFKIGWQYGLAYLEEINWFTVSEYDIRNTCKNEGGIKFIETDFLRNICLSKYNELKQAYAS